MKATKFAPGVALMTALLVAVASAQTPVTYTDSAKVPAGTKPTGAVYTFVDPADASLADIVQTGYKAIDQVGTKLVTETTRELAAKETHLAVSVLHLKGMELPVAAAGMPKITAVKRTSLHIRNPLNTPDGADRAALMKISDQMTEEGTVAKMIVQKIEQEGKPVEWRVYRPIAVSRSCLACHGDPTKFAPGVKEALDQQYPMDQATDYSAQSWRGVLRISLEAAAK
jgi:(2Fe-2S) ferredoxin